ncbi:isoprenylcysteine carboxylmethyltransferase family protein [Paenibacillus sp. G2S3]|uniref:methyltransferase family protein n=1 Tax=Paenibacillus sp. G2S3 TaxID=3047872 RepID=UPI0024C1B569|nr:isoprenylcysteine carboxylmethyltransferase family protein [Paenibacillus sp. G2S3]WHY17671.1 isoprenylcysteine carboxylmethyltransferase family protein [Paenibacillus sp. G2S3]
MSNLKNILSLILFFIFLISYLLKLFILYKKNHIKGNVLAKGKKLAKIHYTELLVKTSTFLWGATWFVFSLAESFMLTIVGKQFDIPVIHFIGVGVAALGCSIFILAMISMRTSWRVGIDKTTVTKLITQGIYKYSRNAAFVGFDLMFLGLYFMYPNLLTLIIFMLNIVAIHLLILQEEQHLKHVFGDEYIQYSKNTPRYILF